MVTFEQRVRVPVAPGEVFAFLSRPENVPLFAPGIDEAVLVGGAADLEGASLSLRTRAGRELRAQITHYHVGEGWRVVDERSTVSQVQLESADEGGTLLTATLSGSWREDQAKRVRAEWEEKLAELPRRFAGASARS